MRLFKSTITAAAIVAACALAAGATNAMPLSAGARAVAKMDTSNVTDVQFRRRRGWGPGVGVGIGAAVIIGGAIAAAEAEAAARRQDAVSYCMSRFRSYNPETGTYVARNGQVRTCP